ncbi:MAG TPA: hypothetical protein VHA73_05935 [Acidimicrobiales bacterium]|jgi:methionine synthase II (cobalamin-independent)|nr:hypothetical protein [Acidimicrobiales bacterium]
MTDLDRSDEPTPGSSPEAVLAGGSPTSIGSLPHVDPAAAVAFELAQHPELPAAPTLPTRTPFESMLVQAGWGVPGVSFTDDGALVVQPSQLDPDAPTDDVELVGEPFATWRAFCEAVGASGRQGPVKLQLTGPVTFGLALLDGGAPLDVAFRVAATAVRDRVQALVGLARRSFGVPIVLFLDEPALAGGLRAELPIDADTTIDLLSAALAAVERHAVTGVHCCGPADWRLVLNAGPQVLSLPVDAGAAGAAGAFSQFLEGGGWVAWGAVPTAAPLGERAGRYWKLLSGQWCELVQGGCDPVQLRRQALLTPECGLALHDLAQAEHVLTLVRDLSNRMHDQALGIRLSVGA